MTPKEEAKELVNKMHNQIQPDELGKDYNSAKECALIAVDELINSTVNYLYPVCLHTRKTFKREYWQEVKQEIEKL